MTSHKDVLSATISHHLFARSQAETQLALRPRNCTSTQAVSGCFFWINSYDPRMCFSPGGEPPVCALVSVLVFSNTYYEPSQLGARGQTVPAWRCTPSHHPKAAATDTLELLACCCAHQAKAGMGQCGLAVPFGLFNARPVVAGRSASDVLGH